jgi:uncharacterized delta-60 repeat protein
MEVQNLSEGIFMNQSTPGIDPRAAGNIDLSFGKEGFVEGTSGYSVRAITEHRGAIVYAEWGGDDIRVCRLHADGSVDTDFGQNGAFQWTFEPGHRAAPEQLISQPDGKIVLLGRTIDNDDPFIWRTAVSRFHPNGSPDLVFDTRIVPYPYEPGRVSITTHLPFVALQADGKLLITTGYSVDAHGSRIFEAGRISRLQSTGATDPSFGIQGQIEVRINGQNTRIEGIGLLSSESGESIVISAMVDRPQDNQANQTIGVACFKSTGLLDQGFAEHGYWEAPPATTMAKMLIDHGRVVCLGTAYVPDFGTALWLTRLTAQGEVDPGFNNAVPLTLRLADMPSFPTGLLQAGARLNVLMTGDDNVRGQLYLLGIREDGSLDLDFGEAGVAHLGSGRVWAGAIQSDNQRLVIAADLPQFDGIYQPTLIGLSNG